MTATGAKGIYLLFLEASLFLHFVGEFQNISVWTRQHLNFTWINKSSVDPEKLLLANSAPCEATRTPNVWIKKQLVEEWKERSTSCESFYHFWIISVLIRVLSLTFPRAVFSPWMSHSDRMWNAAVRVEDSPRSGEEKGRGGAGFQVWVTVGRKEGKGHVPVCSHYGMAAEVGICMGVGRAGSSGVTRSHHRIHSCWGSAEWEKEKKSSHDVRCSWSRTWSWMGTMRRILLNMAELSVNGRV